MMFLKLTTTDDRKVLLNPFFITCIEDMGGYTSIKYGLSSYTEYRVKAKSSEIEVMISSRIGVILDRYKSN